MEQITENFPTCSTQEVLCIVIIFTPSKQAMEMGSALKGSQMSPNPTIAKPPPPRLEPC